MSKTWSRWASGLFKRQKPLGSEPWFNPESVTEQKREWLERQQKAQPEQAAAWPEHIFENFFILGLPPDMELTQVAEQLRELEIKQRHHDADSESELGKEQHVQPPQPCYTAQVLYRFPAASPAPISDDEVAALAFPEGVSAEKLRRTASLSALDELIMGRDSDAQQQCFVFMLKVGGNFPLYGCCWYVREMLHRPPGLARLNYSSCRAPFRQCMIAAPRCYCLLSHYPFFELHFRVLKIVLDLERLERLLEYDLEKSRMPQPVVPMINTSTRSSRRSLIDQAAGAGSSSGARTHSPSAAMAAAVAAGSSNRGSLTGATTAGGATPRAASGSPLHLGGGGTSTNGLLQQDVSRGQRTCATCAKKSEDMHPPTPVSAAGVLPKQQQQQQQTTCQGLVPGVDAADHPEHLQQQRHQQPQQQQQPSGQLFRCDACGRTFSPQQQPEQQQQPQQCGAGPLGAVAAISPPGQQQQHHHQHHHTDADLAVAAACHHQPDPGAAAATREQAADLDAVAAAMHDFDDAAAAASGASSPGTGRKGPAADRAAAAGDDHWVQWQTIVSAFKGPRRSVSTLHDRTQGEVCRTSPAVTPTSPQETSMVQRMWEVWAPRAPAATCSLPADFPGISSTAADISSSSTSTSLRRSGSTSSTLCRSSSKTGSGQLVEQQQQQQAAAAHRTSSSGSSGAGVVTPDAVGNGSTSTEDSKLQTVPECSSSSNHHSSAEAVAGHAATTFDGAAAAAACGQPPSSAGGTFPGPGPEDAADASASTLPAAANAPSTGQQLLQHLREAATAGGSHTSLQQEEQQHPAHMPEYVRSKSNSHVVNGGWLGPHGPLATGAAAVGDRTQSLRLPCRHTDDLVSAFAAIAAGSEPFSNTTSPLPPLTSSSSPALLEQVAQPSLQSSSSIGPASADAMYPAPAAAAATAEAGLGQRQRSLPVPASAAKELLISAVVLPASRVGRCSSAAAADAAAAAAADLKDQQQLERSRSQPSASTVASGNNITIGGAISSASIAPQLSFPSSTLSRMSSCRKSALFEEVAALRQWRDFHLVLLWLCRVTVDPRSADLSADLCRTIGHLAQADGSSLLAAYHSSPVPLPGELYRLTVGDLYRLEFERSLPLLQYAPPGRSRLQQEVLSFAEVECAQQLQLWTVAALCRSLSLDNIITLLNGALLEKQVVVFCPHIGTLAAAVLALVPLLRPFCWQSLMMPVTPRNMLGFLEAPVPFLLGVQYKTPDVAMRCHGLMRVNVYKDAIKHAALPAMPNAGQLMAALSAPWAALREASPLAAERPVHIVTPDEEEAARSFLAVTHDYLSKLCGDLRLHTIVNVGMSKRTGVFMQDSLVESLPVKDRPFMRAFTETQMFGVYADGVISDYCDEV